MGMCDRKLAPELGKAMHPADCCAAGVQWPPSAPAQEPTTPSQPVVIGPPICPNKAQADGVLEGTTAFSIPQYWLVRKSRGDVKTHTGTL